MSKKLTNEEILMRKITQLEGNLYSAEFEKNLWRELAYKTLFSNLTEKNIDSEVLLSIKTFFDWEDEETPK